MRSDTTKPGTQPQRALETVRMESNPTGAVDAATARDLDELARGALAYAPLEDLLAELLDRIRSLLEADTAAVLLLDEARGVLLARAAKGIEEEVRVGVQVPIGRGFAGRIAAEARPVVLDEVTLRHVVNPILVERGIRCLLGVPLFADGRVIGVMHVGTLKARRLDEEDVRLLQRAADRAALAIDRAQLGEQRTVTALMQRTLLPEALPQLPGLRFSAKYLPAGSGIKVGGDWYDVLQMPDGRVAMVIGDVVGRGVVAASVMAEARTAARAYLLEGHDLSHVMSLLDELLSAMGRNRSATAAIYALDAERGELSAVSAGHLPALLLRPDGSTDYVGEAQGPPLGIGPWNPYDGAETVPFAIGSTLLLYTDGLIERRGEPIDVGFERLRVAAHAALDGETGTFADRVYGSLVRELALDDDVALLAVESLALGEDLELSIDAAPQVLASLRRTVGRWLMTQEVPEPARFDVVVAVSEAACNAVEHAYGAQDASFSIRCERRGTDIRVTVTDTGRWLAAGRSRVERGRGLLMIRELMDDVTIDHQDAGTVVTMLKHAERAK